MLLMINNTGRYFNWHRKNILADFVSFSALLCSIKLDDYFVVVYLSAKLPSEGEGDDNWPTVYNVLTTSRS